MRPVLRCALALALALAGCKKSGEATPAAPGAAPEKAKVKIGLVTDVGGRGDQSFNDSGLRGLETWAAGLKYTPGGYVPLPAEEFKASVPADVAAQGALAHLGVEPRVVQAKSQEDYEPDLQLCVDDGAALTVGVGFMFAKSMELVAKRNPQAHFLLVDSPILDSSNTPYVLPNVATVTFREQEGSFLVGALAAQVTQTGKVGFVGGMELPLIKKFEAGFRAGVRKLRPDLPVLVSYTGSFDNASAGKQAAQDLLSKGADVIFQAAGADGLGVIAAVKDARAAGKAVYVVGVDSDQSHVAPEAVLTSMVKHVDLAVYRTIQQEQGGAFKGGDTQLGLKEGGVGLAPLHNVPNADKLQASLDALAKQIASGELKVPGTLAELEASNTPAPGK
jgi:basic membrane protein A